MSSNYTEESLLKAQVKARMIAAMKAKEHDKLPTLRLMLSLINNKEIEQGIKGKSDLDDAGVIAVLKSMVKSRENVIADYQKLGDTEAVQKEQAEIDIISEFLPQPYAAEEVAKIVAQTIKELSASSIKDMGKVMGAIAKRDDNVKIDKTLAAELIKKSLDG